MRRRSFKSLFLSKGEPVPKTKLIAVRLPDDLEKKLKALAKEKGVSFSQTLIKALRYALDDENSAE